MKWKHVVSIIVLIVMFLPFCVLAEEPPTLEWERTYYESPGYGKGVAVDREGNIYIAGSRDLAPLLIKYSPTGDVTWTITESSYGPVGGVAVDGQGNVYTVGMNSQREIVATKYNSGGSVIWSVLYSGGGMLDLPLP